MTLIISEAYCHKSGSQSCLHPKMNHWHSWVLTAWWKAALETCHPSTWSRTISKDDSKSFFINKYSSCLIFFVRHYTSKIPPCLIVSSSTPNALMIGNSCLSKTLWKKETSTWKYPWVSCTFCPDSRNSSRNFFPIKTDKLPTHLTPKAPCCGKVPKRCWSPRFKWNWSCFGRPRWRHLFFVGSSDAHFPKKILQAWTVYGGKPSIFGKASKMWGKKW